MAAKFVISYLKKCQKQLSDLGHRENISVVSLWIDSVWSYIRYGCTIRQYVSGNFFSYSAFERKKVFTCRKFFKFMGGVNDSSYTHILEDKALFNHHFSEYVHRQWTTSREMDMDDFNTLCNCGKGIIVKPLSGMEGDGIYKIKAELLSSAEERCNAYDKLKKTSSIIEELIEQHPLMCFGSKSVNTIRAITLMDKNSGEVSMLKTVLRAGVGDAVVDNYHQGGCCYEVDVKTGRVCSFGVSTRGSNLIFHPGTDTCMLGYAIPNWDKVVDGCIKAHALLPQCRYISWDVAVTPDGMELIEGNHNGDYDMIEFVGRGKHWPTLKKYM